MLLDKIQLEADEKIIIQTRRHWFILAAKMLGPLLAVLIPPFVWLWIIVHPPQILPYTLSEYNTIFIYFYSIWLLMQWVSLFTIWTNYYLDVITLTDRRVILMDQKGFFYRNIASFRLERMQDMHIEINGVIATFLDFGTIHVDTAGHSNQEFHVTGLPHPRELKASILTASDVRMQHVGYQTNQDGVS